jgi:hypothetical protein
MPWRATFGLRDLLQICKDMVTAAIANDGFCSSRRGNIVCDAAMPHRIVMPAPPTDAGAPDYEHCAQECLRLASLPGITDEDRNELLEIAQGFLREAAKRQA